ncbi:MAG: hypothetical protein ACRDQD_31290, partial [Nocardioidaceae bacterium]
SLVRRVGTYVFGTSVMAAFLGALAMLDAALPDDADGPVHQSRAHDRGHRNGGGGHGVDRGVDGVTGPARPECS